MQCHKSKRLTSQQDHSIRFAWHTWASTFTMKNVSHISMECQCYEIIQVTAINTKNTGWRANVHCSHAFVCLSCRARCFLSTWSFLLFFVLSMPSVFKCCQLQVYPSHVCTYSLAGIARRMCERMYSACNSNNNNYNVILMFFYKSVLSVMIYLDTVEARIGANYLLTWLRLFVPVCSPYIIINAPQMHFVERAQSKIANWYAPTLTLLWTCLDICCRQCEWPRECWWLHPHTETLPTLSHGTN